MTTPVTLATGLGGAIGCDLRRTHHQLVFVEFAGDAAAAAAERRGEPRAGPVAETVADLLGSCNIAGFAATVYVAATANSGWARQVQYDRDAVIAFVLAP